MLVAYRNLSMSTTDPKGRGTIAPGLYEIKADFRESKAVSNPHFERPGSGDFRPQSAIRTNPRPESRTFWDGNDRLVAAASML